MMKYTLHKVKKYAAVSIEKINSFYYLEDRQNPTRNDETQTLAR